MAGGGAVRPLLALSALCVSLWTLSAPTGVGALPPLGRVIGRPYTMLEFRNLQCAGRFDRSLVAQLNMVCRDCLSLFHQPEVYGLCR